MNTNESMPTAPFDGLDGQSDRSEDAFLIVNGVDLFALKETITSIGRRIDNVLVLNDPRISRTHAELRNIRGRFVVFDLNSTGGTYVNGKRVSHSVVYDGDVISLAGVNLIFRQRDLPRPDLNRTAMF